MKNVQEMNITELKQLKNEIAKREVYLKNKEIKTNVKYSVSKFDLSEFRSIKGYEGLYSVNRKGLIYSYRSDKFLKPIYNEKGYLKVGLNKNGKYRNFFVHRIVAEAFIPNPKNFSQVNHINYKRDDNRVENLEWCDNRYNSIYSLKNRKYVKNPKSGERYITKQGNYYLVRLFAGGYESKAFRSMEEAVKYRDKRILERKKEGILTTNTASLQ